MVNKLKSYKKKHDADKLLKESASIDITDLKKLSNTMYSNIPSVDFVATNYLYGHAYHLKLFAGLDVNRGMNCAIQHGAPWPGEWYLSEMEASHHGTTMLTFGEYGKKCIESLSRMQAVPIGPYIAYARDYGTKDDLHRRKRKIGRTLLVFPSHGIAGLDIQYDIENFIREIKKISRKFDTVMVCMHHHDISIGLEKPYKSQGYMIVSAGNPKDVHFLSRQRLIFQLCDAVVGNTKTTGLAYALYFDKPLYIFRQQITFDSIGGNNASYLEPEVCKEWETFCRLSSDPDFGRMEEQKRWGEYYFGFSRIKTKDEMRMMLSPWMR